MSATTVYELYPCVNGFSTRLADYEGTAFSVAATSVRQAYAVAHKNIWINPHDSHPVGIVSIYRVPTGFTLWCGCSGHDLTGGHVRHSAGVAAVRSAIKAHAASCPNEAPSLQERFLALKRPTS